MQHPTGVAGGRPEGIPCSASRKDNLIRFDSRQLKMSLLFILMPCMAGAGGAKKLPPRASFILRTYCSCTGEDGRVCVLVYPNSLVLAIS